jgi:hypothetical protein
MTARRRETTGAATDPRPPTPPRARRASELKLAEALAKRGHVQSARALVKRQSDGPTPVIEVNRAKKDPRR